MVIPYKVAVTGHRNLNNKTTFNFVAQAFHDILTQIRGKHVEGIAALSGLAEGADTLFVEIALTLNIPVEAVIAYHGFINDFPIGPPRDRYQNLLAKCNSIYQLPFYEGSDEAYLAVGKWLVDHCQLLIAAWDGHPSAGKGGTGDVVTYALKNKCSVVHIHTIEHIIKHIQTGVKQRSG